MRIAFWGTPEFALPSLAALTAAGHEIVAVVTRPDRRVGRGRRLTSPPVRLAGRELGVPVLQPDGPRESGFARALAAARPELSVVVAYGRIIPSRLLELPVLGSINVHASLLPELRGAAPVAWAIARGHSLSGVSVMRMVEEMDAGPILSVESTPIQERESASELSGRLSVLGAETLVSTVRELEEGRAEEAPQDHDRATFAPRITRRTARIRWEAAAADVARLVRAMDEKPGAWSELRGRPVKLFAPRLGDPSSCERNAPSSREGAPSRSHGRAPVPGTVLAANRREGVVVACGEGSVALREVQPAGKRRMPAGAWLAGRGVSEGDLLV